MAGDMTEGSIPKTLISFAIPLMLSSLLQQLYNWADALIVGNFVGELALAAVGATASVSSLLLISIAGFTVGISIMVAQAVGAKEYTVINQLTTMFSWILGLIGLVLAGVGAIIMLPLLTLMQTPADIISDAAIYLRIVLGGLPFMAMFHVYSAILRGSGDSRTPLLAMLVSCLSNLGMDIIFVALFHMGVAGAAYATVISQILMTLFIISHTSVRQSYFALSLRHFHLDRDILTRGLHLSIPTATQSLLRSMGNLLLQSVMNSFGSTTVIATVTAYRIDSIGMLPIDGMRAGITTFTAQNQGAARPERAKAGLRMGTGISIFITVLIPMVVYFQGRNLLALFGISQEAIDIGFNLLMHLAAFYPLFALGATFSGYLQGLGLVAFVGICSSLALGVRILASYLLAPWLGNTVIAYAEIFSWAFTALLCTWRMISLRAPKQ